MLSGEGADICVRNCLLISQNAVSEYDVAYTDIPGVETLEGARNEMATDIGYTIEEIEKVSEKKEEIVTAYVRRKEGEAKIRKLGGIIIGGLSLLCLPALSFTMPQFILSCSMSSICVVYNTDQFLQGKQLLDAAETRNTDAEIDKMVDFHNETLNRGYEIMGNITTAYSGTLCMGTLIYGLGGGNVTFLSVTENTCEDLLTDHIAGNIDEALGGGSPLRSMLISSVLSNALSGAKGALDVIDGADVRKAADIDIPDVKTVVKDIDVPDVKNVVNSIDASDIKSAVKDIDVPDVKTATNIKEPVVGTQQGNIQSEIKTDVQTAIDVVDGDKVLKENGIYFGELMSVEEAARYSEYWRKHGIGSDKTWKEFISTNPKGTIDDYFEIVQKQSPWPLGEKGTPTILKSGDRFFMAVENDAPENLIGGFGVKERIDGMDFVRNNLAVKYDWKTSCNVIREFEINSGIELNVNAGPVGPQIDLGVDLYLPGDIDITQYDLFSNLGSGIKREDFVHIVDEYWVD